MGYIRLEQRSDWGNVYLALPGKGLTKYGCAEARLGIPFQAGQRVHVRWPDNSQSEETIVMRTVHSEVSDMGHTYPVSYNRPGVETQVRGVKHWTALADLWVLEEDLPVRGKDGPR